MQQHISCETSTYTTQNGEVNTKFSFIPSPGTHMAFFNGKRMVVERTREKAMVDLSNGLPFETVKLYTVGRGIYIYIYAHIYIFTCIHSPI